VKSTRSTRYSTIQSVFGVFARVGVCDAPFPFDYLVSKEEKALSSGGERDYLVQILAVPVLSSIAGVEYVQNTPPMSIVARQVDNSVQNDPMA